MLLYVFRRFEMLLYLTWLGFVVRYRKTIAGPVWLLLGPSLFILFLGALFARINDASAARFIPHMTIGLIAWTLIGNTIVGATRVFQGGRTQILEGGLSLIDLVVIRILTEGLVFLHQVVIIIVVLLIYPPAIGWHTALSLLGLLFIFINAAWVNFLLGIIGVRYRDLSEIVQALMRIAFLATPIIWMPDDTGRGGLIGHYLAFNPFHHFLALVRDPLLGRPVAPLSWMVVIGTTIAGMALARMFYRRYHRHVPLWV